MCVHARLPHCIVPMLAGFGGFLALTGRTRGEVVVFEHSKDIIQF